LDVVVVLSHVGSKTAKISAGCRLDICIDGVHRAVQVEDALCCHLAPINLNLLNEGDFLRGLLEYQAEHWVLHDGIVNLASISRHIFGLRLKQIAMELRTSLESTGSILDAASEMPLDA